MKATKPMNIRTRNGRVDLEIERDAGNPILILMGTDKYALLNWRKLKRLSVKAIKMIRRPRPKPINATQWFNSKTSAVAFTALQKRLGRTVLREPYKDGSGWRIDYVFPFGKLGKGDLVEYIDCYGLVKKAIIMGSENDSGILKNHVEIKGSVISIGQVSFLVEKEYIPKEDFQFISR